MINGRVKINEIKFPDFKQVRWIFKVNVVNVKNMRSHMLNVKV